MAIVRVELHRAAIDKLLRAPSGPVHKKVSSVMRKTEALAVATAPVDTGRLKNARTSKVTDEVDRLVARIEFTVDYALVVHQGHGVIRPRNGKFLVFRGADGSLVFAKQVRAVEGRPFLVDALKKASPWPVVVHPL